MPTTAMLWDSIKAMLPEPQPEVQPGKAIVGLPDDTAERTVRLAEGRGRTTTRRCTTT